MPRQQRLAAASCRKALCSCFHHAVHFLTETAGANETAADGNATAGGGSAAPGSEGGDSKTGGKDEGAGGKGSGKPPVHDSPSEFWDKLVRTHADLRVSSTPSWNATTHHGHALRHSSGKDAQCRWHLRQLMTIGWAHLRELMLCSASAVAMAATEQDQAAYKPVRSTACNPCRLQVMPWCTGPRRQAQAGRHAEGRRHGRR